MDIRNHLLKIGIAVGIAVMASSCTTSYDAYGRPQQTVDPGLAVAGIAAAALVGYALASDHGGHHGGHGGHGGGHYGGHGGGHYGGGHRGHGGSHCY
ncbi:MAG: hypothetical protein P8J87_16515 [Verrucomicrobiales bacterium]|nr:hypothetical protein [Verrucomicrobiales bacterium]